jgi:hypothetical protein
METSAFEMVVSSDLLYVDDGNGNRDWETYQTLEYNSYVVYVVNYEDLIQPLRYVNSQDMVYKGGM